MSIKTGRKKRKAKTDKRKKPKYEIKVTELRGGAQAVEMTALDDDTDLRDVIRNGDW